MGFSNPLLVMHTEKDELIDISHAEQDYKRAASHKSGFCDSRSVITTRSSERTGKNTWPQWVAL